MALKINTWRSCALFFSIRVHLIDKHMSFMHTLFSIVRTPYKITCLSCGLYPQLYAFGKDFNSGRSRYKKNFLYRYFSRDILVEIFPTLPLEKLH
jgi:hypothetical protein